MDAAGWPFQAREKCATFAQKRQNNGRFSVANCFQIIATRVLNLCGCSIPVGGGTMVDENKELDELQRAYKTAVEDWIAAIREEEALGSVNHSVAEVDEWEHAHYKEEDLRKKAKTAKKDYEAALRFKFFGISK
jgi:hypothetical protein